MRVSLLFAVSVFAAVGWGCDGFTSSQLPAGPGSFGPQTLQPAASRKTTSERIALVNLNAAIDSARRRLDEEVDIDAAFALVEQLVVRADFYRNFDDWEEALQVSRRTLDARPEEPTALLLHARVLSTVHEFDAALELVHQARRTAASRSDRDSRLVEAQAEHLETSIGVATATSLDAMVDQKRSLARAVPTFQHVTSLALALAEAGDFVEADAAFRRALEDYRDVSPFPFAWVAFQRGVMWSEWAGRPDLGRILYEEALEYLPGYVLANVHLAELEAAEGNVDAAIARVTPLIDITQDPEPLSLLADLAPPDLAKDYAVRARSAYRTLIERFPNAFAHHAPSP